MVNYGKANQGGAIVFVTKWDIFQKQNFIVSSGYTKEGAIKKCEAFDIEFGFTSDRGEKRSIVYCPLQKSPDLVQVTNQALILENVIMPYREGTIFPYQMVSYSDTEGNMFSSTVFNEKVMEVNTFSLLRWTPKVMLSGL